MAQITPNLNLTVWNLSSDTYNHEELANNFIAIDQHDHSGSGKGSQIDGSIAIKDGTITNAKLGAGIISNTNVGTIIQPGSIGATQIENLSITTDKLANSSAPNYTDGVTTDKIANSAITTSKINNGAVTDTKLASSTTVDTNRAVTTNHIRNASVTAEKIFPGAISRTVGQSKLGALPIYYKGDTLPVGASSGDEILYAPASDEATPIKNVVWHLRWSQSENGWQFIGGSPLYQGSNGDRESSGWPESPTNADWIKTPRTDTWYRRWPYKTGASDYFNKIDIPFHGAYTVTYGATFRVTDSPTSEASFGVWGTALSIGIPNDDLTDPAISETGAYQMFQDNFNAPTSISSTIKIDVLNSVPSNSRSLNQVHTIASSSDGATISNVNYSKLKVKIYTQYMQITPIVLRNWT